MALPFNTEDLLWYAVGLADNRRKIEGNRIEFKIGWGVTEVERRANLIGMPRWSNVTGRYPAD